jgi:ATP-binding cassette, subfamily B, bacterial MsbA
MIVSPDAPPRTLLVRLIREYVRPHRALFGLAFLAMALEAATTGALAKLIEPVLDEIFVARNANMLTPVALGVLVVFVFKALGGYLQALLLGQIGNRVVADMQKQLFRHLIHADLAFFQARQAGALVAHFTSDIRLLQSVVSNAFTSVGKDALTLMVLVGVMFWQDWRLAVIAFVVFPVAIYPISRLGRRMRKITTNAQHEVGTLASLLGQAFQGIRQVKADHQEGFEITRTSRTIDALMFIINKANRVRAAASPMMEALGGIAIVAVILYGGQQVIAGTKTTGNFFSFITAFLMAYEPVKRLSRLNTQLQEGVALCARVFQLMDIPATITEAADARPLRITGGTVTFAAARFAYADGTEAVKGISFTVSAGHKVALVGASGGGKSTLINLIPRFHDLTDGSISIDGQDIRSLTLESLRRQIALVSQDVVLFDDTVAGNIAYSRPEATEAEMIKAAKAAAAHEFITALPDGYQTRIGEHGVKLSGGQRQRLSIARALLKDAPILLLDEATSALDTESERRIQDALQHLMQGRTTLVVAHRLSTIQNADCIHVIDSGTIVESGQHSDLLAQGGAYARLYRMQFGGDDGGRPAGHD